MMILFRLAVICVVSFMAAGPHFAGSASAADGSTTTPIKHVVVIFQENNSFDHYFATYPNAANPPGEPPFTALSGTPRVNGLSDALLARNPNSAPPFRLDRSQAVTCDNDNAYADQQKAFDHGLVDKFPESTSAQGNGCLPNLAMGYYDGNTVTALWNYAQRFAMSDNSFSTEFGTTVMGHINLISGQTHQTGPDIKGKIVNGSIIGNVEAAFDDCTGGSPVRMAGKNVGDLLNAQSVTWGWFYGEFAATAMNNGKATCNPNYNTHYDPFQYYESTANPHHLPPVSPAMIGQTDQANHQYDLSELWHAIDAGFLPAVSFIKSPDPDTGHPQKSDPLHEQAFLADTINRLEQSPDWKDMAIIIAYDDSDGWYDHVMPPIVNESNDPSQDLACGSAAAGAFQDRCGYGERLPLLVISPYARQNYVDHAATDQASILRFIEDNWGLGRIDLPETPSGQASFDRIAGRLDGMFDFAATPNRKPLLLDPDTGEPVASYAAK
jgi:phospholipase C